MTTTLKNGMSVTPPSGYFSDLTFGKNYKVFDVDIDNGETYFFIKSDSLINKFCILNDCAHISNLNWKIVEK